MQNTIKSTDFVIYVCDKLLPITTWNMIATTMVQDQVQLRLLKVFAEMSAYCDVLDKATERIDNVYQVLRVCMRFKRAAILKKLCITAFLFKLLASHSNKHSKTTNNNLYNIFNFL